MAGNKGQKKFQESKIPKKGEGKVNESLPIFKEPNNNSEKIGTIQKGELLNWISKSICDECEWIRLGKSSNFGYIIGYDNSGKCNMDIESIKETKIENNKITEISKYKDNKNIIITKEEMDFGMHAMNEILNESSENHNYGELKPINIKLVNDYSTNESIDSTEYNNSIMDSTNNDFNKLNEDEKDIFLDNLYYDQDISKNEIIEKEQNKLINELYNSEQDKNRFNEVKGNNAINEIFSRNKDILKDLPIENFPRKFNFTMVNIPKEIENKKKDIENEKKEIENKKKEIENNNKLNLSENNELNKFISLSSSKIGSTIIHKFVWIQYYDKAISLKDARSLACKINSFELCNENYIKNIYGKFGIVTSSIECLISCVLIVKNDKFNNEEKIRDLTKEIVGTAGSIGVGKIAEKGIGKISKCFPKLLKILLKTSKLVLPKFTPIGILGGFAIDCILSYLVTKITKETLEELIQKIFDYFESK